jgi:hypothetical protein
MALNNVPVATPTVEHFCTLFDSNYLPLGITLHQSLLTHAQPFHLWVLCMDDLAEQQLRQLNLPHLSLISLSQVETPELLAVKGGRTRGEYCWTLTPFTFQAVFEQDPNVQRVTYLDADLFFFAEPSKLLAELADDKHVLLTEHAYAPEYDQTQTSGRFCVQFLTFRRTVEAARVMKWWQERCVEWCFNRVEDGKFGDQKYLDAWTDFFVNEVQIVQQAERTLAPWNIRFFEQQSQVKLQPVFYHFHGLKMISPTQVQLYSGYRIGKQGLTLYQSYLNALNQSIQRLKSTGFPVPYFPLSLKSMNTSIGYLPFSKMMLTALHQIKLVIRKEKAFSRIQ